MKHTVTRSAPAFRKVSVSVWGEAREIQCPAWCTLDHNQGVISEDEIFHAGESVTVRLPGKLGGLPRVMRLCVTSWPNTETDANDPLSAGVPFAAVSTAANVLGVRSAEGMDAAQVLALAEKFQGEPREQLRLLGLRLRTAERQLRNVRRAINAERVRPGLSGWLGFMDTICAGCSVGPDGRSKRRPSGRKFIVPMDTPED